MARKYGVKPTPETQEAVAVLVRDRGLPDASALLGIGRSSVARIALGVFVTRGTIRLAEHRLAELQRSPVVAA